VSGISPKSGPEELAGSWLGIGQMISELSVRERLDEEAHQPYSGTEVVGDHEAFICSS